jgi:NTE family protein
MRAYGVFEGGGAKGFCHVGALKAAEERGIQFEAFAGTSIGAIVASLACAGYSADELLFMRNGASGSSVSAELFAQLDEKQLEIWRSFSNQVDRLKLRYGSFDSAKTQGKLQLLWTLARAYLSVPRLAIRHRRFLGDLWNAHGIHDSGPVAQWLDYSLKHKLGLAEQEDPVTFGQMPRPLLVVATDLAACDVAIFGRPGDEKVPVAQAVVASAAFPFFFMPPQMQDRRFVDGGVLSNLPAWVLDELRMTSEEPLPTFGFRLVDLAVPGLPAPTPDQNFLQFAGRLLNTWLSGGRALETRGIDDCHVVELKTDISTLEFDSLAERSEELFNQGYKASIEFFDRELGPRDPEMMRVVLRIIANFFKATIEAKSVRGLSVRASIVLSVGDDIAKVAYCSHSDADDRVRVWKSSDGPGKCFRLKQPIIARVNEITERVRKHPHYKFEHALRPKNVSVVYSVPIFRDSEDWILAPDGRKTPIGVLVLDVEGGASSRIDQVLHNRFVQDRLATYAQVAGVHMTRNAKVMTSRTVEEDDLGSQLPALPVPISPGFWISERTLRHMVSGGEMTALRERIVAELASLEHAAIVGHPYPKQGSGRGAKASAFEES